MLVSHMHADMVGGQKRSSDVLELELGMVLTHMVDDGI